MGAGVVVDAAAVREEEREERRGRKGKIVLVKNCGKNLTKAGGKKKNGKNKNF